MPKLFRDVDFFIGARLRLRRREHGLSQGALGEALAVTFQQIQKYEIGISRVSAGTLYEISKALDVPIGYFFDTKRDQRKAASDSAVKRPGPGALATDRARGHGVALRDRLYAG